MKTLPFHRIAPSYDRINTVMSLGLHHEWKEELVNGLMLQQPSRNAQVLDVAAGTGDVTRLFSAKKFRRVIGMDPCSEMLAIAKRTADPSIHWVQASAEAIPLPEDSVDIISCAFGVRNFSDRLQSFKEWHRLLRPGGVVGILEIHPLPDLLALRPLEWYWRHVLPLLGRQIGDEAAYEYLRDSVQAFLSPEGLESELKQSGFHRLSYSSLFACGMVSFALFQRDGIEGKTN